MRLWWGFTMVFQDAAFKADMQKIAFRSNMAWQHLLKSESCVFMYLIRSVRDLNVQSGLRHGQ